MDQRHDIQASKYAEHDTRIQTESILIISLIHELCCEEMIQLTQIRDAGYLQRLDMMRNGGV